MVSRAPKPALLLSVGVLTLPAFALSSVEARVASAQPASPTARTPPMGWSSADIGCEVTERVVKAAADAMSSNGMSRVGYQHILVGDCWQGSRDRDGFIEADATRFPTGMKALADYVHARGLKFGLYSGAGNATRNGHLGSRGHEYQDALQYARWGVDYLEYDWHDTEEVAPKGAYTTMRDALRASKRQVTFHISEQGASQPWSWAPSVGHLWRTATDLATCFSCVEGSGSAKSWGVLPVVDRQDDFRSFAGPGHWNDPGLLQVGNGMSPVEDRAHFSLWAMLAAPLTATDDLASMAESTRELLTNPEVIAVDQDILGVQGFRYRAEGELDVWVRPLSRGQLAVLFLNRGQTPLEVHFDWSKHRVEDDLTRKHYDFASTVFLVRDLWGHQPLGTSKTPLSTTLQSHDVTMLRLTPQK
jgi:alpha-galactosidase